MHVSHCVPRTNPQLNVPARYIRIQLGGAPRPLQGAPNATKRPGDVTMASVRLGDGTISYSRAGSKATVHVSHASAKFAEPVHEFKRAGARRRHRRNEGKGSRGAGGKGRAAGNGGEELQWWVEGVLAREGEVVTRDGDVGVLSLAKVRVYHKGEVPHGCCAHTSHSPPSQCGLPHMASAAQAWRCWTCHRHLLRSHASW